MVGAADVRKARVLLADDHPGNKQLLRTLLEDAFVVVGAVDDGHELVLEAERLSPDAIVTDVAMPGMDGIEAAHRILARDPDARIVIVTGHGDPGLIDEGLAAGVLGYVAKSRAGEALVPAVRAALQGKHTVFRISASSRRR